MVETAREIMSFLLLNQLRGSIQLGFVELMITVFEDNKG